MDAFTYNCMEIKAIAHIETDFGSKFGVPRQSGVVAHARGRIVFEKEYRVRDALRGLEEFSHIWLLWDFSESHRDKWSPTVRPPRLGGNKRVGVFATRSPYRPNNIGLSSVRLVGIDYEAEDGPVLLVEGADMVNGTPIYDIKPYLAYTDMHRDATSGFVQSSGDDMFCLDVELSDDVRELFDGERLEALKEVLANDPRPHYQTDDNKQYVMEFGGHEIKFVVRGGTLTVL